MNARNSIILIEIRCRHVTKKNMIEYLRVAFIYYDMFC
jgi:hypothetical protein